MFIAKSFMPFYLLLVQIHFHHKQIPLQNSLSIVDWKSLAWPQKQIKIDIARKREELGRDIESRARLNKTNGETKQRGRENVCMILCAPKRNKLCNEGWCSWDKSVCVPPPPMSVKSFTRCEPTTTNITKHAQKFTWHISNVGRKWGGGDYDHFGEKTRVSFAEICSSLMYFVC